jgi:hypothetical protein
MIKVRLMGGLGNQMFQYALGLALSKQLNTKFIVDDSILLNRSNLKANSVIRDLDLDIFNLDYTDRFTGNCTLKHSFLIRNLNKILPYRFKNYFVEKHYHYDKDINLLSNKNIVLEGYWQSHKYFDSIKNEIFDSFSFKSEFINKNDTVLNDILSTNSVCLNVRRGDFLNDTLLGFKDVDFFVKATNFLESKIDSELHYFIFSDDISWCQENLNFLNTFTVVDHSHKGHKFANYLFLMSSCKHFIIPNSTFAWWAAWLSKNAGKIVISPADWFNDSSIDTNDLIPSSWFRV